MDKSFGMECIIQNSQYISETSVNENQVSALHNWSIYVLICTLN